MKKVTIYADGAASPNPGPAGYGVVLLYGDHRKEMSAGFELSTNNRMELLGVIAGLEALKEPCEVTVYSDSKYVIDTVNEGWLERWKKKGKAKKNLDLWDRFIEASLRHQVTMKWVPSHDGVTENEVCDRLAVNASKLSERMIDPGFDPEDGGVPKVVGDPCRKCRQPVVEKAVKKRQSKFDWYLYCPSCDAVFLVDAGKKSKRAAVTALFTETTPSPQLQDTKPLPDQSEAGRETDFGEEDVLSGSERLCHVCKEPISAARLAVRPRTFTCVPCLDEGKGRAITSPSYGNCPKSGDPLVLRISYKWDPPHQFLGCLAFPDCRFLKNLD